jgi:hypothetical protein
MKKIAFTLVVLSVGGLLLQACGPAATPPPTPTATTQPSPTPTDTATPEPTPTEPPRPTPTTPPPVDMIAWLMAHPFIAAPEDFQDAVLANQIEPPIDLEDLPEGFIVTESRGGVAYLPDGEIYMASTIYLHPSDGEVATENEVSVGIVGYVNETVREYHFEAQANNRLASLVTIGEYEILSYYDQNTVGHVWISGPFAINVTSKPPAGGSPNPWLPIFSGLMLELYPPDMN